MKQIQHIRGNRGQGAFTLIELLVVIAIIGILAGLLFTAFARIQDKRAKAAARAQLAKLETMINNYHAQYNSYPLDNPNRLAPYHTAVHPLYYELAGATFNGAAGRYETVAENITESSVRAYFYQDGLRNVTQDANNPESPKFKNFMESLNSDAYSSLKTTGVPPPDIKLLVFKEKDIEANMLTNANDSLINPWRYISTNPTNNQGRFDLWVEFEVGGSRYRVSNWEKDPVTLARPQR